MSHGATARLFVAVDPPARVREELAEWACRVAAQMRAAGVPRGAMRLLDADSLHLTLCFLGSRPVSEIDALAGALAAGAVEGPLEHACEASVGAPLWLPPRRPHALTVEINDRSGGLASVQEQLGQALASASAWKPERRRFRPHITVARVRGNAFGRARRNPPVGRRRSVRAGSPSGGKSGLRATRGAPHGAGPAERHPDGARASAPVEQPLPATPPLDFSPAEVVLYRSWLASAGATYEALARGGLEQHAR